MFRTLIVIVLAFAAPALLAECGDCDQNGTLDVIDAWTAAHCAVGMAPLPPLEFAACDVDATGDVNILDALQIAQFVAGFPLQLSCVAFAFDPAVVISAEAAQVTGGADPGEVAAKGKLVRLTKTPAGVNDGRLVSVYADAANTEYVWTPKSGLTLPHDIFARFSDDDGSTWSNPVNISRTAGRYSARTDWDGDGTPEDFWGHSGKPTIFSNGNNIVVSWVDKYAPEAGWTWGASAESSVQGTVSYPDPAAYPNERTVPFSCVYCAVSNDGGATWIYGDQNPPIQLTQGRRDAIQDSHRGSGAKWVMSWQEDPAGLQPGEAEGPGDGSSGAKTSKGTDVWYTFTPDIAGSPLALRTNRTPLTDHSVYDTTQANGYPLVDAAGSMSTHGASRANLFLLNDSSVFKALVAYEETKAIPEVDEGKTVQYHAFPFAAPVQNGSDAARYGAPGVTLTDPLENSRRVRLVAQPPNGIDPAIAIFWKQGFGTQGAPSDIMLKASTSVHEASVLAASTLNISSNTPSATPLNLSDSTSMNPLEDARAHRAILRGPMLVVGYSYTGNGIVARYTDLANYNFFLRRSLDGGATWLDPQNASGITDTTVNVKEPRLVAPAKTGTEDPATFIVAWGTETNIYEGFGVAEPLDIWITRTTDQGATFATVTSVSATLAGESESQLRVNDDCSEVYAVWMSAQATGVVDVLFAHGVAP